MSKLFEALDVCLKEIDRGADVDTILFHYPDLADELRPILEASVKAKQMVVSEPSQEVVRRNRAKILQHAAEMREMKAAPVSRQIWSAPLRRALVTLMVLAIVFVSSSGLVRASSNTLPGDNLYPVKRSWEDIQLFFTFDANEHEALTLEYETERLEELHELFAEGRSVRVEFSGYVTRQAVDQWRVSGITVFISSETQMPGQQVAVGDAVRVIGRTQNGGVLAERIDLLPSGVRLPEVNDDELEAEEEKPEDSVEPLEEESESGSILEAPAVPTVPTSTPEFEPEDVTIEGSVVSIENNFVVVNGVIMDIQFAEVKGVPVVGVLAKVEGYYDASGVFIVIKIEFENASINSGSGSGDDNVTINDNSNDNDSNDDKSNDNNGNDDKSGSGGGGGNDD